MSDLDVVLERVRNDPAFAAKLAQDPVLMLAPYDLTVDDLMVLAARIDEDHERDAGERSASPRRSALLTLLTGERRKST